MRTLQQSFRGLLGSGFDLSLNTLFRDQALRLSFGMSSDR